MPGLVIINQTMSILHRSKADRTFCRVDDNSGTGRRLISCNKLPESEPLHSPIMDRVPVRLSARCSCDDELTTMCLGASKLAYAQNKLVDCHRLPDVIIAPGWTPSQPFKQSLREMFVIRFLLLPFPYIYST